MNRCLLPCWLKISILTMIALERGLADSAVQPPNMDELVGRSQTVVEGVILEVRSVPFKKVSKGLDGAGESISEFVALKDDEYRLLLKENMAAADQLTWRHIAIINPAALVASSDSDSSKKPLVVEYVTYPASASYGYQGRLPMVGRTFTFFIRKGDLFPAKGGLTEEELKRFAGRTRIDLTDEIGPPGIAKTLFRRHDGKLQASDQTPNSQVGLREYLLANGWQWKLPLDLVQSRWRKRQRGRRTPGRADTLV